MKVIIERWLGLGLGVLVLAALFSLAARLWWVFELFTHASFYWFGAAIVIAVMFFALRRWRRGLLAVAVAVFFGWGVVPYFLPHGGELASGRLKLLHFNVLGMNRNYDEVREYLVAQNADIVVLQEFEPKWRTALVDFVDSYDYKSLEVRRGAEGMALLSRFPLTDINWDSDAVGSWPQVSATVGLPSGEVQIVALHPPPPVRQRSAKTRNERLGVVRK